MEEYDDDDGGTKGGGREGWRGTTRAHERKSRAPQHAAGKRALTGPSLYEPAPGQRYPNRPPLVNLLDSPSTPSGILNRARKPTNFTSPQRLWQSTLQSNERWQKRIFNCGFYESVCAWPCSRGGDPCGGGVIPILLPPPFLLLRASSIPPSFLLPSCLPDYPPFCAS
jgi:hypothetical protein